MANNRLGASFVSLLIALLIVSSPATAAPGDPDIPTDQTDPDRCSAVLAGDHDGDGLSNYDECQLGTSAVRVDTDGDGVRDPIEVELGSNPTNSNTDGDALPDGCEYSWSYRVRSISLTVFNPDSDGDSIPDAVEYWGGTNPSANDTDDDLLRDREEWNPCYGKAPAPGPGPALDPDIDGDGLLDGIEVISTGTNRFKWDTDGDGWPDGEEVHVYGTDPLDPTDEPSGYPPGHP